MRIAMIAASALALCACSDPAGGGGGSGGGGAKAGEPCATDSPCVDGLSCQKDADGDFVCTAEDAGTDGAATGDDGTCKAAHLDQPCNPYCPTPDNGCAEGEVCTLGGTGLICRADGTQKLWMGCNEETFCAEGGCVEIEGQGDKCAAFCRDDEDCGDEYQCLLQLEFGGTEPATLCTPKPPGCSVFAQDCEEAGTACYLAGETSCLAEGDTKLGEDCNAPNDCAKRLICVSERCHEPCFPTNSGPVDDRCMFKCTMGSAEIQDVKGIGICSLPDNEPSCNLLQDDCTEPGQACYYTADGARCRAVGESPASSPCEQSEDCAPGLVCWPLGSKCRPVCNPAEGLHNECSDPNSPCSSLPGTNAGFCDE